MKATTKNEIDKTLEIAIKQLNNAIKNIEKAEELAFNSHEDVLYKDLNKHYIETAKAKDGLFILSCMVKHHAKVEENEEEA